jgi:hypothetical protein
MTPLPPRRIEPFEPILFVNAGLDRQLLRHIADGWHFDCGR